MPIIWNAAVSTETLREILIWTGLLLILVATGCAAPPKVTKVLYEDRSAWIRLEINPDADESVPASANDPALPSSATLAALFKGFQAEKDYNPGLVSFITGKTSYNRMFVDPELMVLAPQLAKALAQASPLERVAYCLTADYSPDERFITTGWVYIKKPHLYFKLVEWRTPVRVKSPAVPTSEACVIKPIPGVKTADRFFKMDYAPKAFIETFGPMDASIMNKRGEVVFKLAEVTAFKPAVPEGQPPNDAGGNSRPEASAAIPSPAITAAPKDPGSSSRAPVQKTIARKKASKTP